MTHITNNEFRLATITIHVKDILGILKMLRVTIGLEILRVEFDPIDGLIVFIQISKCLDDKKAEYTGTLLRIIQQRESFTDSPIEFGFRAIGMTYLEAFEYLTLKNVFIEYPNGSLPLACAIFTSPFNDNFVLENIPQQETIHRSKELLFEKLKSKIPFPETYKKNQYCNLLLSSSFRGIEITVPSLSWYVYLFEELLGFSTSWGMTKEGSHIVKFIVDPVSNLALSFRQNPKAQHQSSMNRVKFLLDAQLTCWEFNELVRDFPDDMHIDQDSIDDRDSDEQIDDWSILDNNGFEWSLHNTHVYADLNQLIYSQL